jgi:tetratricopeptide (TPR) repeat protein
MKSLVCFFLLTAVVSLAQSEKCSTLKRHGKLNEASACFQSLTRSSDSLARAEGYLGLRQYQQANDEFRQADKEHPNSAIIKTAWGNLFLQLEKSSDASDLFREAIAADANYVPAYVALARTLSAEDFDNNSSKFAKQALEHDPKYFPAYEVLSYLALEEGNNALATEEAQKAVALSPEALEGMAVLASMDLLKGNGVTLADNSPWMDRILKIDPAYGEAYAVAGHFLEINYRYSEAIAAYRKALELDPELAHARSQLGVNLMRIGQTDEAQKQLAQCYQEHFQNAETRNSLKFLDTVNQYQHFTTKSSDLLLNKSEAALLRPYIEPELQRAMSTYEREYKMTLPGIVRLEVYPNHEDFVVRTLGLPGQGGLLGVTFGTVVAIDSPTAREPGDFSWADTMWHELCHVYVITATHHLVPRWFSEGLAVHEEGVVSPYWGNRLNPETVAALKQKKLLPVLELDSGFVRPQYPGQVLVSYYQAGQLCDFIAQRWGDSAILGMIHSYADHKTTQEALQDNLHESPEAFDKDFLAWLSKKTDMVVSHIDTWRAGMKSAAADLKAGNAAAALAKIRAVQDFFPEYSGTYDLLAKTNSALGQKTEEMQALEKYRDNGGTGVDQLKRLAKLQLDSGHPEQAMAALQEINWIYPEDQETHQRLGTLFMNASRPGEAIREYRAVLALKPTDIAQSHLDLARALNAAHQTSEAKDQVLLSLEAAPNFKPAQQLLLQLSQ